MGQDDVGRERGQFRRVPANLGGIGRGPAGVDAHVAADGPTQQRQSLVECRHAGLKFRIVRGGGQQYADAPHAVGLLGPGGERPRRRATQQRDELAPLHVSPGSTAQLLNPSTVRPGGVRESAHNRAPRPLWVISRHVQCTSACPLCANSGHDAWIIVI